MRVGSRRGKTLGIEDALWLLGPRGLRGETKRGPPACRREAWRHPEIGKKARDQGGGDGWNSCARIGNEEYPRLQGGCGGRRKKAWAKIRGGGALGA